ncbi:TIGR03757 family integrating conjugative element protein [Chimaeribacter californicus]|uniref:TIGR03757 family integrating conjugative element protein n=1 Tax=Chimaeribacter californicus TaxID=2060067 RepID=A0A2N5E2V8_9GAMM|nr:TIGR03757 family integrating conjugative element protein [Chimaeribacter californicus]PLR35034.1 TIGR03757 family integrating conjugative element protein [Chimaeribacter californicus]
MTPKTRLLPLLAFAIPVSATTVVYTDSHHPPLNLSAGHQVVYLDAPQTAQRQIFGELPSDPVQAERAAKAVIQSSDWPQKQQQIAQAYQGVLQAYSLKLEKYPSVVFDDKYVVYGTTDVALAESRLAEFREAQ